VTISGEDLPALPDTGQLLPAAGEDPAVGLAAPKLVGQSFDESEVVIDPSDGTPKMVVFLAHWCPHCQAEVPLLQEWIASGDVPEGLEIYAVSTGVDSSRPNYPPSNWIASEGWEPQVLLDDDAQTAAKSWGLTGFPYVVMLDADGNVWQRGSGEIPVEDLQRLAEELVKGQASTGGTGSDDGLSSEFDPEAPPVVAEEPTTTVAGG
jgi:thiol-disulfide isomerase/thioredoxin